MTSWPLDELENEIVGIADERDLAGADSHARSIRRNDRRAAGLEGTQQ